MSLFKSVINSTKEYAKPTHKAVAAAGFLTGYIQEELSEYTRTFINSKKK